MFGLEVDENYFRREPRLLKSTKHIWKYYHLLSTEAHTSSPTHSRPSNRRQDRTKTVLISHVRLLSTGFEAIPPVLTLCEHTPRIILPGVSSRSQLFVADSFSRSASLFRNLPFESLTPPRFAFAQHPDLESARYPSLKTSKVWSCHDKSAFAAKFPHLLQAGTLRKAPCIADRAICESYPRRWSRNDWPRPRLSRWCLPDRMLAFVAHR